jgi:hypothetical protein
MISEERMGISIEPREIESEGRGEGAAVDKETFGPEITETRRELSRIPLCRP